MSETSEQLRPRASLSERARAEACRLVGADGLDVAAVVAALGVGWATVMRAVRDYGRPLIDDPARLSGVVGIGVDETAFLAANGGHHTPAGHHRHRPGRARHPGHACPKR